MSTGELMKVLAYVHAYVPFHNGGAETTLHDILKAFVAEGHEAQVVLRESPYAKAAEYEIEGVKVVQAMDKRLFLHHLLQSQLVITHLESSLRGTLLAKQFRVPVAQLIHNNLDLTKNYVGHGPDFLIFNSAWIEADYKKTFPKIPSIVVHPPIIAERYRTTRGKKVTLVNLFESKGQDLFYKLVETMPDVEFLAVEGGYGTQIVKEFPNLEHFENNFDIREAYSKTKIILMPSTYESYGRVACEALASGIPSIVSNTDGLKEALGDAGTFVPREKVITDTDVKAWETALRALLTPRRYGAMSKAALARSEVLDSLAARELSNLVLFSEQFIALQNKIRGS
jgi:glycosyltransferase involved in cell wall biosynthesis